MTKRMLTAVLTVALTLSLTACGGRTRQEMGETRTVYTMDTVMNLTAYGETPPPRSTRRRKRCARSTRSSTATTRQAR